MIEDGRKDGLATTSAQALMATRKLPQEQVHLPWMEQPSQTQGQNFPKRSQDFSQETRQSEAKLAHSPHEAEAGRIDEKSYLQG